MKQILPLLPLLILSLIFPREIPERSVEPAGTVDSDGVFWKDESPQPFLVCVSSTDVHGSPSADSIVLDTLPIGTEVRIRERSLGILGWAMIEPARWVWEQDLC